MKSLPPSLDAVAIAPPTLDTATVAAAVSEQFALHGDYTALVSERDQNFRLQTSDGNRFVVKVTSSAEPELVSDFQIAALRHLETRGFGGVPRVITTRDGGDFGIVETADGVSSRLRIVSYLEGTLLDSCRHELPSSTAESLGIRLAELDRALDGFSHPGQSPVLIWDLQRASDLSALTHFIEDDGLRRQIERILDTFEEEISPALDSLSKQVIHNDVNTENVLLDISGNVCGIIDFGDMLSAPRVVELAIAASYLGVDGTEPLVNIVALIRGYQGADALSSASLEILLPLVSTRIAMSLCILHWRLFARGEDDEYCKKSLAGQLPTLHLLNVLSATSAAAFQRLL